VNTTREKIRAVKSQIKIAVKQYNQAERALTRLVKTLDQLEKKMNWRKLNKELNLYSEEQVLQMLNEERVGASRVTFLERLHQRYTMLRASRERVELMKEAVK
jgi:hypothetical protein